MQKAMETESVELPYGLRYSQKLRLMRFLGLPFPQSEETFFSTGRFDVFMGYSGRRKKGNYSRVPETSGIYRLYHGDTVVYMGETGNLARRLKQHEREMGNWGSYNYKSTKGVPKSKRKKMERRAIKRNRPTRQD